MKNSLLYIAVVVFVGAVMYQIYKKYTSAHGNISAQAGQLVNSDLTATSGEDQYS